MSKRQIDRQEALHLLEKSVIDRGHNWIYPEQIGEDKLLCEYFIPPNYIQKQIDETRSNLRFWREQRQNKYTDEQIEDLAQAVGEAVRADLEQHGLQQNGPACLVGQALSYVGLNYDLAQVEHLNDGSVDSLANSLNQNSVVSETLDWSLDGSALDVLRIAQFCNDRHVPWGAALEISKEYPGWQPDVQSLFNPGSTASADEQADRYAGEKIDQYVKSQES